MTKGTASKMGGGKTHIVCRRCGRESYHLQKKRCASCGFGGSSQVRHYSWAKHHVGRGLR